jgi:hypothetical protein
VASNHYVTKRNRRPKNKRRKDYTASTMIAMRSEAEVHLAAVRRMENTVKEENNGK